MQYDLLQIQQSEMNLKSLKSQWELVQQEASVLQQQLSSAKDEGTTAKQEVPLFSIRCSDVLCQTV